MYCTPLHASQYYTEECEFSIIMFPKFRECLERQLEQRRRRANIFLGTPEWVTESHMALYLAELCLETGLNAICQFSYLIGFLAMLIRRALAMFKVTADFDMCLGVREEGVVVRVLVISSDEGSEILKAFS